MTKEAKAMQELREYRELNNLCITCGGARPDGMKNCATCRVVKNERDRESQRRKTANKYKTIDISPEFGEFGNLMYLYTKGHFFEKDFREECLKFFISEQGYTLTESTELEVKRISNAIASSKVYECYASKIGVFNEGVHIGNSNKYYFGPDRPRNSFPVMMIGF